MTKDCLLSEKDLMKEIKKDVSTDTLAELPELVLKNSIFNFNEKNLQQKRDTAIEAKFAPPYIILFMAELKEKVLEKVDNKPHLWWRYIHDIFFIWEHGEEKLRNFVETLNETHPTIKFTAECSQKSVSFFDASISLIDGKIQTDLYVEPADCHQ